MSSEVWDLPEVEEEPTDGFYAEMDAAVAGSPVQEEAKPRIPSTKKKTQLTPQQIEMLGQMTSQSSLDIALSGRSEFYRMQVLTLMTRCKISPNDPVFLLMVAMAEMEHCLLQAPVEVKTGLADFLKDFKELLASELSATAVEEKTNQYLQTYEAEVRQTASQLVAMAREDEFIGNARSLIRFLVPASAILIGTFVAGVAGTLGYFNLFNRSLINADNLTVEQYQNLELLGSAQGRLALNLIEWNDLDDLGEIKRCQQTFQQLGIKVSSNGKQIDKGVCVLYVSPENQRGG